MTNLVNKDTYRHKDTEVWKILAGKLGEGGKTFVGGTPWHPDWFELA